MMRNGIHCSDPVHPTWNLLSPPGKRKARGEMRAPVSLGSRQPWITSGHLASSEGPPWTIAKLLKSFAALQCMATQEQSSDICHITLLPGQRKHLITQDHKSGALPAVPTVTRLVLEWGSAQSNNRHLVLLSEYEGGPESSSTDYSPTANNTDPLDFPYVCTWVFQTQRATGVLQMPHSCRTPKEKPRGERTAIFSWKTRASDS